MQLALYELNDGRNPADSVIFRDITASLSFPDETAARVRDNLGVSIDVQQTTWRTVDDALRGWRDAIEDRGVFVFKNSFKQREVSGFCLHDPEFPIIYVNNSTPATRQVFTILHELGHLLAGSSGITKSDDHFIARLSGRAREIELFCNRFAAEVLLPAALLPRIPRGAAVDEMRVADIAAQFKVSREVVLRRYRDQDAVTRTAYEELVLRWRAQDEARAGGGGGNYYATQGAYFGQRFLKLAFGRYYQGTITVERLADMLDVRPANVLGLEPYMVEGR
jgi:Zn-dependent peptidase ImmA (M78 family)